MSSDAVTNQAVTAADVANLKNNTLSSGASLASDFDNFLVLLTTQLQNQDPMNPTDSTEFTNQLVQFSQVEQAINTNQKLDSLVQQQFNNALGQAVGFVGLDATYPSAEMPFDGETPVDISYYMPEDAHKATIYIYDDEGNVVNKQDVSRRSGTNKFTWDGTDDEDFVRDAGTYGFAIEASDASGDSIKNIQTIVTGNVDGVESQGGSIFLLVGERAVPLENVINAQQPKSVSSGSGSDSSDQEDDTTTEDEGETA